MARRENPVLHDETTPLSMGGRLRLARRERGLGLTELAAQLGYSKPYLSAVENGTARASAAIVAAYEDALHLAVDRNGENASSPRHSTPEHSDPSLDQIVGQIAGEFGMLRDELELIRDMLIDDARAKSQALRASLDWWKHAGPIPICCIPVAGWQWHEWPFERIAAAVDRGSAEAMQARIREIVVVLPPDKIPEMERVLRRPPFAERLQSFTCVGQPVARGLGHAILQAQPIIGIRPFALLLPDDQFDGFGSEPSILRNLVEQYAPGSPGIDHLVAVAKLKAQGRQYGIARLEAGSNRRPFRTVERLVEKPSAEHPVFQRGHSSDAATVHAVVGRYVLSPSIMTALHQLSRDQAPGSKIELLDALQWLIDEERAAIAAYVLPSLVQLERDQTVFVTGAPATRSGVGVA